MTLFACVLIAASAPNYHRGTETIATEVDALDEHDSGKSVSVKLRTGVDWRSFTATRVGPVDFDLDPKWYRRRFDKRSRDWVDERLSDESKRHLADTLKSELDSALPEAEGNETLYIEPVVTMVRWSMMPGEQLSRRRNMSARSAAAGSAAVRFNLRRGGPGGELVGTVLDHWRTTLGDGIPRATIWFDAERGFHFISERLATRLQELKGS